MMGGGLDGARRLMGGETQKPKDLRTTLARFWQYFKRYWIFLVITLVLLGVATWTQVLGPDIIGQAVDCYLIDPAAYAQFGAVAAQSNSTGGDASTQQGFDTTCTYTADSAQVIDKRVDADQSIAAADKANAKTAAKLAGLGGVVLTLLGLYVLGSALQGLAFYSMRIAGENVLRQLRQDLFRQINRLSLGYYAENETGNIMSRITSDTDAIQQVFAFALLSVVSGVILLVWIFIKMLQTNVPYALLSLVVAPIMFGATTYFSNQARKAFRRSRAQMGSVNAGLEESIAGVREVQAFNRQEESIEQFRQTNAANRDANVRAATFTSALTPTLEALGYVSMGIVIVVGGIAVLRGGSLLAGTPIITLGIMTAFMGYVQRFNQPIQQIALLWTNVQNAIAGGERIFGLLDTPADIVDKPNAKDIPLIQGKVEFDAVHAEYKKGEPVLNGINFAAKPGQIIAIVGPTGAGKTTIINLIPRFYDVSGGSVKIDDVDVRDVTMSSLRSQIGLVLQDSFLFSDTVMNNIRYGRLDATDEEVIAAAKLASADSFIERLPQGYQTILGERGSGLSQGQRQLISIARAALKNPRILILDEATSSVDTRTERIIQKAFEKLLEGRTSFVIAHRLSTIRNADLVMLVRDGHIIERGTHTELLEKKGAYYDLYMSQFRYEEEPSPSTNGKVAQPVGD